MPDKYCSCGKGDKSSQKNNVIDLAQYRWRRAGRRLRRKLAEFADHEMFLEDAEIAREYFFAVMDEDLADEEDEMMLERFFEWFIFDYRIREQTLVEYFELAGKLAPEEKELLGAWKGTKASFYQVLGVDNKSKIVLEDVIRGGQVEVNDPNAVHELEPGQIMLMRILPVGAENEFSTGGLVLPPESHSYILSRVKLDAELYWGKYGQRDNWDLYLGAKAHMLNALAVEVGSIWGLSLDEDGLQSLIESDGQFADMAQQVTNIFLDYFYDRWVNEPMGVLQGKTPMEASRTKLGRQKLQTLLYELGKIEIARAKKGEPYYDLSRLRHKLSLPDSAVGNGLPKNKANNEVRVEYDDVAQLIRDGLEKMGYRSEVTRAMELWEKYSRAARPVFRKPGAWAAAVIYAVAKLLGDENIKQNELAHIYNVSASTISTNYRSICHTLQLKS